MSGSKETAWEAYRKQGLNRATRLGNRAPVRFDENGHLSRDILDAYRRTGSMSSDAAENGLLLTQEKVSAFGAAMKTCVVMWTRRGSRARATGRRTGCRWGLTRESGRTVR